MNRMVVGAAGAVAVLCMCGVTTVAMAASVEANRSHESTVELKDGFNFSDSKTNPGIGREIYSQLSVLSIPGKHPEFGFPYHGNWCGPGHSGPGAPIDDLDRACMHHDMCYGGEKSMSCCDADLLNELNQLDTSAMSWGTWFKIQGMYILFGPSAKKCGGGGYNPYVGKVSNYRFE